MVKRKENFVTRAMYNPAHPGELLKEVVIKGLNLKVSDAAKMLDIDRTTLSRLINGHISISVEMALRLSKAVDGSSPEFWLNMQQNYDLSRIRKNNPDLSRVQSFSSISSNI